MHDGTACSVPGDGVVMPTFEDDTAVPLGANQHALRPVSDTAKLTVNVREEVAIPLGLDP